MARNAKATRSRNWRQPLAVSQLFPALPYFNVPGAFCRGPSAGTQWPAKAPYLWFARLPRHTPSAHVQTGLHFFVQPAQITARQFTCSGCSCHKRGLRLSSKKTQMVGAPTACCLTLRSRGRPNGMAHWPSSAGPCGPFCACCPVRHAVGLPLNSNVRPHKNNFFRAQAFARPPGFSKLVTHPSTATTSHRSFKCKEASRI
jgi:hypothetical protein